MLSYDDAMMLVQGSPFGLEEMERFRRYTEFLHPLEALAADEAKPLSRFPFAA